MEFGEEKKSDVGKGDIGVENVDPQSDFDGAGIEVDLFDFADKGDAFSF